jgi:hypothetical protein
MLIKKVSAHRPNRPWAMQLTDMILGRLRPQAPRAQPQGQGLQVPPDSHRVPYPPSRPLLPHRRRHAPELEVRVRHRLHHGRLSSSGARMR